MASVATIKKNVIEAINCCFYGTASGNARLNALNSMPSTHVATIQSIQQQIILHTMKKLHNRSVQKAIEEYKTSYLKSHPDHPTHLAIPVALASDGRWQKRWGWNSLDGIGVKTFHHEMPGN